MAIYFFNSYGLYNKGYAGQIAVMGTAPIERIGWQDFLVNSFFLDHRGAALREQRAAMVPGL